VKEVRDEAVVLRTYRLGESDRIVVFWGRESGKMRSIAKGVRKPGSKIGGGLEPLAHVDVYLAQGRGDLRIVRQATHRSRFAVVKASFDRINAGYAIVEAVDAIPADDVPDEAIFTMLVRALETLDREEFFPTLVPAAFFLKLLAHDGSEPVVDFCVNCQSPGPLVAFDAANGGTTCAQCRTGRSLSAGALSLLRRLCGGDLASVLREENPPAGGEVAALAQESLERHFGKRLKVARSTPATEH